MNKHELKSLLENIYYTLTEDDWYNDPHFNDSPLPPYGGAASPTPTRHWTDPPPKTGLWTDWHPPLGDWLAPVDHYPIPYALPPTIRRAKITPTATPLRPRIKPTRSGPVHRYRPDFTIGPDDPYPHEYHLFDHWLKDPELKSLLENIYTALTEDQWYNDKHFNDSPLPPYGPPPTPPTTPTLPPNGMSPIVPPMPLDPNGNPLFPSQKFWAEYYRAMRALPMDATMITHPAEMERFLELTRQLQEWQRTQDADGWPQPNDGGTIG